MNVYGITNCDTVKEARPWLAQRGVSHRFVDFKKTPPTREKLAAWCAAAGWQTLLNRRGTTWKKLEPEAQARVVDERTRDPLMVANPTAIRRPVVESDEGILVGFDPRRMGAHVPGMTARVAQRATRTRWRTPAFDLLEHRRHPRQRRRRRRGRLVARSRRSASPACRRALARGDRRHGDRDRRVGRHHRRACASSASCDERARRRRRSRDALLDAFDARHARSRRSAQRIPDFDVAARVRRAARDRAPARRARLAAGRAARSASPTARSGRATTSYRPMWAHVWRETVQHAPDGRADAVARAHRRAAHRARGRVRPARAGARRPTTRAPCSRAVEWIAPGFEIVQSHFPGWKFTSPDCTAAFGLHRALVVGPRTSRRPTRNRDALRRRAAGVRAHAAPRRCA